MGLFSGSGKTERAILEKHAESLRKEMKATLVRRGQERKKGNAYLEKRLDDRGTELALEWSRLDEQLKRR
jgi:hypothetical protein